MIAAWARHLREFSSTLVRDVYDNRQTNTSLHDISTIYVRHPHDKRILLYENIRVKGEIRQHVAICVRVMHDLYTRIVRVRMTSDDFGYKYLLNGTYIRKRKISESIPWQKSLYHRNKKVKKQHKDATKTAITQWLRTDLGQTVGVHSVIQLVWLNRFTRS